MYKRSSRPDVKKLLYFIPAVIIAVVIFCLRDRLSHIIGPVIAATIISAILSPPVSYLIEKKNFKPSFAAFTGILLLIVTVILILVCIISPLLGSFKDAVSNSVNIASQMENLLKELNAGLQHILRLKENSDLASWLDTAFSNIQEKLFSAVAKFTGNFLNKLTEASVEVVGIVVDVFTTLVLTFYFLRDRKTIRDFLLGLFPFRCRTTISDILSGLGKIFSDFLKGQLLVSVILGILQTAGLFLLKIPYALILGFMAGLLNIVPYFGPFIGVLPAVIAAFFISPWKALTVVFLFLTLQQVDNIILTPKIVEGQLKIHPIATIIAVFVGGELLGFWGILFGVPIYAALRFILQKVFPSQQLLS